ncbi:glycosyltransferase family 2 protein [Dethiobacter alkaliphilus]|uniref:glycosyltransferase family 2 protein n=1 Tax=Dethiobacter alkaliphilus TaxID=427926 RepID=UPI002226553A|nr:glycosyltransferase [Dethiobacter alkaliphilus]MCW3489103.1 glycosyltransferase [Dethiobacter alkaliphilus]
MLTAVVPALNEEQRIGCVLRRLLRIEDIKIIYVILNGSNIATRHEVDELYRQNRQKITVVTFTKPLGIDVPRAVGAKLAYCGGATYTLFVDGDLVGDITKDLSLFINNSVKKQLDLALTDCYPHKPISNLLNEPMFFYRKYLNQILKIEHKINIASPSHGPHMVSRRLLRLVPWEDFCIPPTLLAYAVLHKLQINIAGIIPHACLGSQIKNGTHTQLIVDTIAGDCLEAACLAKNISRSRTYEGKTYLGYHQQRRFDLLHQFLAGRLMC